MEINGLEIDSAVVGSVGTNCYIVRRKDAKQCVVVDPGDNGRELASFIKKQGMMVEGILLTHAHFDHILGVTELKANAGGRICVLEEEKDVLENADLNVSSMAGEAVALQADLLLKDGQKYEMAGLTFAMIHTPGHTKGSCCFYMEEEGILFSGDTLFFESIGRTDLPTGNGNAIRESLNQKLLTLPEAVKVFPGHGPVTEIGYEKDNNPYVGM